MSGACWQIPPVQADYSPKGSYTDIAGFKSYNTGSEDSKSVILYIYDIFGYSPQILQGADILSSQEFRVVMPDFLKGDYATGEMFSGSEEGNKQKEEYFKKIPGSIGAGSKAVAEVTKILKENGAKVGVVGACWGYKVAATSEAGKDFDAIAGIHPSFAAVEDGDKISAPLALLPSGDEDMDIINKIHEAVEKKNSGKNLVKHYPNMPHGWMAARGDVKGGNATDKYADGYQTLAQFFKENL